MATKSQFLLVTLAILAASHVIASATTLGGRRFLAAVTPAPAPAPAPGADEAFVILNTQDDQVVKMAKMAVDEYNSQNKANLIFDRVFAAAYTNDAEGVNYGLVIIANDGTGLHAYNANLLMNKGAITQVEVWKKNVE